MDHHVDGAQCDVVSLDVCGHSHGLMIWHIITIFSTGIDLDAIVDEFDGQAHQLYY